MVKLLDELGYADEVMALYQEGKSFDEIKQLLMERHPTGIIPTTMTIRNYVNSQLKNQSTYEVTGYEKKDFEFLINKLEMIFQDTLQFIPKDKRKELLDRMADYKRDFNKVYKFYSLKDEKVKDELKKCKNRIEFFELLKKYTIKNQSWTVL